MKFVQAVNIKSAGGINVQALMDNERSSYRTSSSSWGVGGLTLAAERDSVQSQDTRYQASKVKGRAVAVDAQVLFGMGSEIEGDEVIINADKVILKSAVNRHEVKELHLESGVMDALKNPKLLLGGAILDPQAAMDALFDTTTSTKTVSETALAMTITSNNGNTSNTSNTSNNGNTSNKPININGQSAGNRLTSAGADINKDISGQLQDELKDEMKGKNKEELANVTAGGSPPGAKEQLLAGLSGELAASLGRFNDLAEVKDAQGKTISGVKLHGVELQSGNAKVEKKTVNTVAQIGVMIATGGVAGALLVGAMNVAANGGDLSYMEGAAKNAAMSYVGGQLTAGLNDMGLNDMGLNEMSGGMMGEVANQTLSQGMASWLVNGGSLEDALKNSAKSVLIASAGKMVANQIGDNYMGTQGTVLGELTHKLSHAALGCAMGAASAGSGSSSGCESGAFGGVVGEVLAQVSAKGAPYLTDKGEKTWLSAFGLGPRSEAEVFAGNVSLTTGLAAQVFGLDQNIATSTAKNAVENNYLAHEDLVELGYALHACRNSPNPQECVAKEKKNAEAQSTKNDTALQAICTANPNSADCQQKIDEARKYAINDIATIFLSEDQTRSANMLLTQVFSTEGGENYFSNITARKQLFQALDKSLKEKGNNVAWVAAAANVSEKLEWLKHCNGFGCSDAYAWMEETGNLIMSKRWDDLGKLFVAIDQLKGSDAKKWDEKIVKKEQFEVQLQYEKLPNGKIASFLAKSIFDITNIKNEADRVEYGKKLMEKIREERRNKK